MGINRHRLLAPVAIGAAALSLAGTSAAFAAGTAHSHTTAGVRVVSHTERSADASRNETAADIHTDRTKDSPSTGVTTAPRTDTSKDPVGTTHTTDVPSQDAATALVR